MSIHKILFLGLFFAFVACNNSPERPEAILPEGYTPSATTTPAATPTTPATPEPAQNAAGVWHYTCPTGCAGGGASATACGVCGTTLVHNTEYHNTGAGSAETRTNIATSQNGQIIPSTNPAVTTTSTPKPPEPAQNAAGVWHYTCPSGCAGGGGAAGPCGSCGATLAHNASYHQ